MGLEKSPYSKLSESMWDYIWELSEECKENELIRKETNWLVREAIEKLEEFVNQLDRGL